MKKIVFMLGVAAIAAGAQAATFDWATDSKLYGVTAASVTDNGPYAAATSGTTDRGDKVLTLAYTLAILNASTEAEVGRATGTVEWGKSGKVGTSDIEVTDAAAGTTSKYVLTLTGTQSNLSGRGVDGDYDYSAATLTTTLNGEITTATMGNTDLGDIVPSSWTVAGITAATPVTPDPDPSGVPEPTSGLLMLVGLGALALRRRR